MEKGIKFGCVPAEKIIVSMDGTRLVDVHRTIASELNKQERAVYSRAIQKVSSGKKLNADDAKVLNKIDEITFAEHGLCLKDSKMTKARIKACKRYGINFNDRDGLVEHMKSMAMGKFEGQSQTEVENTIGVEANLKMQVPTGYREVVRKADNDIPLNMDDLKEIQLLAKFARDAMGWRVVHQKTRAAVIEACERMGVKASTILLDEEAYIPLH